MTSPRERREGGRGNIATGGDTERRFQFLLVFLLPKQLCAEACAFGAPLYARGHAGIEGRRPALTQRDTVEAAEEAFARPLEASLLHRCFSSKPVGNQGTPTMFTLPTESGWARGKRRHHVGG